MPKLKDIEKLEHQLATNPDEFYQQIRQLGPLLLRRAKQAAIYQEALQAIVRKPVFDTSSGIMKKLAHEALEDASTYHLIESRQPDKSVKGS